MSLPAAPCRDLPTIVAVYPDDKRLTIHVPARGFDAEPEPGAEVVIFHRAKREGPTVRGRIKRLVVEVEIDLATLDAPDHEGQGSFMGEEVT